MPQFSHLHCHTHYSLLDGATKVKAMLKKAKADNMPAVAITDHGNMFGALELVLAAKDLGGIKPIIGCEFYLVENRHIKNFSKEAKDHRYHQLFLAKNQTGYHNLSKLCSLGFTEGMYGKYPRIDKELILKYREGLIATTCCIGAEVPQCILHRGEKEAETVFKWWLDLFGEDYYVELQRHGMAEQNQVNEVLVRFAAKYNVKIIASNDAHYLDRTDYQAHDALLCINTNELIATPKGEGKNERFGFPNDEFYFKTTAEMEATFSDLPVALDNTNEIVDKIDKISITNSPLLPQFPLPEGFTDNDDYLRHLTYEGAVKRYGILTDEVRQRLDFELGIIKQMGFPGYFLIVQDFVNAGKDLGVLVGPGRGSAAGSAVGYCLGITNIDPIKYTLLFERFLNPERVSMPDIDIDFDDEGREKVIQYVVDKYGKSQVAQIITFGTMAAKSSIKDVARAMDMPLAEANALAKLVPDDPGTTLAKAVEDPNMQEVLKKGGLASDVMDLARKLEGTVRNTGIHASAVIIAPDDITNFIPIATAKDAELNVTQFEGKIVEKAGLIKMDFLGLRNLTIIRDAFKMIQDNHGITFTLENIPLDDEKTFELYRKGETVATFQFESPGMRQYLKELKPTNIEDLIAMNALFRPGPLQFIPNFIKRKNGQEVTEYPHPDLEAMLAPTYGIMVYQEQVMQAAQILAGFTLGGADLLRRAMGKKDAKVMDEQRAVFVEGAKNHKGIEKPQAEQIFDTIAKFAEYGFNRSHAAAYSVLAFQTAFLKANYPGEYMAAVLTSCMGNMDKLIVALDECRRMGLKVLGPDINESDRTFKVLKDGTIRFGLAAIKGTGEAAVEAILEERSKGLFKNIWDFATRINLRAVNKKAIESMAMAGSFDNFGYHRGYYLPEEGNSGPRLTEIITRYGNAASNAVNQAQSSLFGMNSGGGDLAIPKVEEIPAPSDLQRLRNERDVLGLYISGHPLDAFKYDLKRWGAIPVERLANLDTVENAHFKDQSVSIGGMVTKKNARINKNGNPFCTFTLEDYNGAMDIALFGKDYVSYANFIEEGHFLYIKGRMQKRFGNIETYEFKVTQMTLLNELRNDIRSITIKLKADQIDAGLISTLKLVTASHPGSTELRLSILGEAENQPIRINLYTLNNKVSSDNEVLKIFEQQGLEFSMQ